MDIAQAAQQAMNFGYTNINPGLITSGPNANMTISTPAGGPDSITFNGLVNGNSVTGYDGSIVLYPTVTSPALLGSTAPESTTLKTGIFDLVAIARQLHADRGVYFDVEQVWQDSSKIPDLLNFSGGTGNIIHSGNRDCILDNISESYFQGTGNTQVNLTKNNDKNSLWFGTGSVTANVNSANNSLHMGEGCNYVKVGSNDKNYIIPQNGQGYNYIKIDSPLSYTVISNWDGSRDHLAIGDNIDASTLRVALEPKSYTYTVYSGVNKIATIIANTLDPHLSGNIENISLVNLNKSPQMSDYGFINTLYGEFFNRAADGDGVRHWVNKLASGMTATEIGKAFLQSAEYTYHTTDTKSFVEDLYHDVFGRSADNGGLEFWISKIDSGMAKINVVGQFLSSPEALLGESDLILGSSSSILTRG